MKDRTWARLAAFLFISTTLAGIVESALVLPLFSRPLEALSGAPSLLLTGVFLLLYLSAGVVGIALALAPLVKGLSPSVARTYLSFRLLEAAFLLVGALAGLFLASLVRLSAGADTSTLAVYRSLAPLALAVRMDAYQLAMVLLGFNSLVLFGWAWRARVLPRWLSGLGLVGYTLLLLSAVFALCGVVDTTGAGSLLYVPGGLFELVVLPVWLTVKGFDPGSPRGGRGKPISPKN